MLRYSVTGEGGRPLWRQVPYRRRRLGMPWSGGARRYKLQLMPQLLHFMGVEARDLDPLDWATVDVYTCKCSCGGTGEGGYVEEFARRMT